MKRIAIVLWGLQGVASLVALVAALANFESIIVTGPTLAAVGLLLGVVTNRIGSPLILAHALAGPLASSIGSLLIAANHWGPSDARRPITVLIVIFCVLSIPTSLGAWRRIRRIPPDTTPPTPFRWQFSLKSMLMVMTAVCLLITGGQWLVNHLPNYPWGRMLINSYWPGFGGFAFVTLLLTALVYRRFRAAASVCESGHPPRRAAAGPPRTTA